MDPDVEGYTCVRDDAWRIVDRFGRRVPGHPFFGEYASARNYADQLNEGVIARRFGRVAPPPVVKPVTGRVGVRVKAVDRASRPLMDFADALEALDLF